MTVGVLLEQPQSIVAVVAAGRRSARLRRRAPIGAERSLGFGRRRSVGGRHAADGEEADSIWLMLRIAPLFPLFSVAALAGSNYTVVVIPPPSGFTITGAAGINNSGQVAGTATDGSITRAFVGSPSGSTLIPLPAAWTESKGAAINTAGVVAGTLTASPHPDSAFIGTPSGTALPPPPQSQLYYGSLALAINDSNQVGEIGLGFFGNAAYFDHRIGNCSRCWAGPLRRRIWRPRRRSTNQDKWLGWKSLMVLFS